ncbi:hypothetical protein LTS10_002618 [Elasticomyces elasticus]|nr:hypothetical protein LTS10_002618 [Elasticomyces elasticus]
MASAGRPRGALPAMLGSGMAHNVRFLAEKSLCARIRRAVILASSMIHDSTFELQGSSFKAFIDGPHCRRAVVDDPSARDAEGDGGTPAAHRPPRHVRGLSTSPLDKQTDSLILVLGPHLQRLHDVSKATYFQDKEPQWRETFRADVQGIVKQALTLKLHLVNAHRLGYKHAFSWASHGMPIDIDYMRVKNAPLPPVRDHEVAFCLASGVLVQIPGGVEDRITLPEVVAQPSGPKI